MAEGGSHVRWGWLDRVWGDGCWQRWGKKGREGRPGLSAGVSDLGVDRIRAAAAPFLDWGGGEDGLSFSAVPAAASHVEQDLTSLPAHRRQTHSGHLNRPVLALLASLHFPFQKTGNIREQTHVSLLICSGQ